MNKIFILTILLVSAAWACESKYLDVTITNKSGKACLLNKSNSIIYEGVLVSGKMLGISNGRSLFLKIRNDSGLDFYALYSCGYDYYDVGAILPPYNKSGQQCPKSKKLTLILG